MILQMWQIVTILVIAFLFGFGIGRTFGEARAWRKMDKQQERHAGTPPLFRFMERPIGNLQYRTEGSTILAVKQGKGLANEPFEWYLMKSPYGRYFEQTHHFYETLGQEDEILPRTKEQAMQSYNDWQDKRVSFEEAFGDKLVD